MNRFFHASGKGIITSLFFAGAILLATAPSTRAQGLTQIWASYPSISGSSATMWIGKEAGVFQKYGIDPHILLIVGGARTVQAFLGNSIQFGEMAGVSLVRADLAGGDLVLLAGVVNKLIYSLVSTPNIKTADELKGKIVGLTNFGGVIELMTKIALKEIKLDPEKDVSYRAVGILQNIIAAMRTGAVQATVLNPELMVVARSLKFNTLIDLSKTPIEFQHLGLATRKSYIATHRDVVERFMKAYLKSIALYKRDPALARKVIAKYTRTNNPKVLNTIIATYGDNLLKKAPYPTVKGLDYILGMLKGVPGAAHAKGSQFVDTSFIKNLQSSGFIDSLYR